MKPSSRRVSAVAAAALLSALLPACSPEEDAPAGYSSAHRLPDAEPGTPFHTEDRGGEGPVEILLTDAARTTCRTDAGEEAPAPGNVHVLLAGEIATGRVPDSAVTVTAPTVNALTEDLRPLGHLLPSCKTTTGTSSWERYKGAPGEHAHLETVYEVPAAAAVLRVGGHQIHIAEGTK